MMRLNQIGSKIFNINSFGHFFRNGGVSKGAYDSLNFSLSVGDCEKAVRENRKRAVERLGFSKWVMVGVVDGATVAHVTKESPELMRGCDGLITDVPGIALMATNADCQVALFYDPVKKAVGAVHAGWRGQVANIYAETVRRMGEVFGSGPKDLRVSFSPSLGPSRAEFVNYRKELPECFWRFQVRPNYFDLWAVAKWQLMQVNILEKNIAFSQICSYDNPGTCFSYRRDGKKSGRNASIIGIKCGSM